ncbi:MAG: hypothetical protein LBD14_06340 [Puniceicoccales bacterium]|jgi:glycerophosphoryl diester phosphodiesterase|nr:hypothetical protein [Puniceicoccales bacterium]
MRFCLPLIALLSQTVIISAQSSSGQTSERAETKTGKSRLLLPIIAHRGDSHGFPENTLPAFRAAAAAGADGCEFDVRATLDGQLVILHDDSLDRTTRPRLAKDKKTKLSTRTLKEIKNLDAGSWKGAKFAGKKIPTLDETLATLKATPCRPVIEIKEEGLEAGIIAALNKTELADRAVIIAFSTEVVKNFRRLAPQTPVALLKGGKAPGNKNKFIQELLALTRSLDISILDLQHTLLSRELITVLHENGITVWAWTVDEPRRMQELLDWGIDGITTNKPGLLKTIRSKHPVRSK